MNKTIAITAAAIIGVLSLSACGPADSTNEAPSHSATPVTPLDREASESLSDNRSLTEGESLFILAVEDYDGIDYRASEEREIADGGNVVCYDLAAGVDPVQEALDIAAYTGLTDYEGGVMVGMAVSTICPEFYDEAMDSADAAISDGYTTAA